MGTTSKRLFLEAGWVFFLTLLVLFSASGQVADGSSDPEPRLPQGEEELLITEHPIGNRGGRLVAALRAEPKTLNPVIAVSEHSQTVIRRLMADLIHINRFTQEVEGALAKSWTVSEDGRSYRLKLRRGLRFSDGHPFDADDVLFTFQVYLDEEVESPERDQLIIAGEPIRVTKVDQYTVDFELAQRYALGERIFDSFAILPEHLLRASYEQRKMRETWSLSTRAADIAGLGPFRIKQYIPGNRCVLERNPYYWKADKAGNRLPYFDEIVFLFIASDDARLIRFQSGDTDVIDRLTAEDFVALERQSKKRGFQLLDLGPGLTYNFLFFNLNDIRDQGLAEISARQVWFQKPDFRRAISLAIDRAGVVRLVFQGRASPLSSHVTPGFKRWINREIAVPTRSIPAARELLSTAGFDWDNEQRLIDSSGRAVEFSVITSSGNSQRLQMATIIQDDLEELGMRVRIVPLESGALLERIFQTYEYDACILGLSSGDADPITQLPLLLSSGDLHLWHLGQQEPVTSWEAEIDRLMRAQSTTVDYRQRKKLFDSVQELMAENQPMIFLASPHVLVGGKLDLGNFEPAVLSHPTLWNVEQLFRRKQQVRAER